MNMGSASAPLLEGAALSVTARSSLHGDYAEEAVGVGQDHGRDTGFRRHWVTSQ